MYLRLYANYIRGVQKMCQRGNNRNNHLYNPSLKKDCDYYVSLLTRNINLTKLLAQRKWSVKIYLRAFVQTKFSHILLKTEQPWGQWWVIFKINLRTEKKLSSFSTFSRLPFLHYSQHILPRQKLRPQYWTDYHNKLAASEAYHKPNWGASRRFIWNKVNLLKHNICKLNWHKYNLRNLAVHLPPMVSLVTLVILTP